MPNPFASKYKADLDDIRQSMRFRTREFGERVEYQTIDRSDQDCGNNLEHMSFATQLVGIRESYQPGYKQ